MEDQYGKIWAGTYSGGVSVYDKKNKTFRHFKKENNKSKGLSWNTIWAIKEDRFDFYIDALLCIESKVLAHTDNIITVTVDNTAMSMLESLDLLEALNRLERSYDLDLFKDLGDG
jgi:hypothetical protein